MRVGIFAVAYIDNTLKLYNILGKEKEKFSFNAPISILSISDDKK